MATIQQIKMLISKGQTEEALKFLLKLSEEKPDIENQALLLSGQYQQWELKKRLGTLETNTELRRIELSILELLNEDGLLSKSGAKKPKVFANDSRNLEAFGKDIKRFLEKEKLLFYTDPFQCSKQQTYTKGFASLTRAYDWLVEAPVIIPTNKLSVIWDAPAGRIILTVEHLELSLKLNIYAQNSATASSSLWDIKTAKDAEFWSSINKTTQTMVDLKIKNDPEFKQTIYNRAVKLVNEKISNHSAHSKLNIIIEGLKLYDGTIEKFYLL